MPTPAINAVEVVFCSGLINTPTVFGVSEPDFSNGGSEFGLIVLKLEYEYVSTYCAIS
jgi:hypothetical protein